jgi:hypothetical protein
LLQTTDGVGNIAKQHGVFKSRTDVDGQPILAVGNEVLMSMTR